MFMVVQKAKDARDNHMNDVLAICCTFQDAVEWRDEYCHNTQLFRYFVAEVVGSIKQ